MAKYIIGTVNQGVHKVGETFSAYQNNTVFLTGVCDAVDYLDIGQISGDVRKKLSRVGGMVFEIGRFICFGEGARIAKLSPREDADEKWNEILRIFFSDSIDGYETQNPLVMTLSPRTALHRRDHIMVSYLSVMEPLGNGEYRLHHDYSIARSGTRYELYDDRENADKDIPPQIEENP